MVKILEYEVKNEEETASLSRESGKRSINNSFLFFLLVLIFFFFDKKFENLMIEEAG